MSTVFDKPERRAQERARVIDALARLAQDPTETPERRDRARQAVEAAMPDTGDRGLLQTIPVQGWTVGHHTGAGYSLMQDIDYEGTADR